MKQKLEDKRLDLGLTQGTIGKEVDLTQASVSLYENDMSKMKRRGPEFAVLFFKAYGFTTEEAEVMTRDLYAEQFAGVFTHGRMGVPASSDGPRAPFYGEIGAGLRNVVFHNEAPTTATIPDHIAGRYGTDHIFVCSTKGNSMACNDVIEKIPEGTECYFHSELQPENGDVVAVWLEREELGVLKIYRPQNDYCVLLSYNTEHRPIIIDASNPGKLQGVLVGVSRPWGRFAR